MPNTPIADHPLIGKVLTFRPDAEPYDPDKDVLPGSLVIGNGMRVEVKAVFADWNGVAGLDMLYVYCPATSMHTHVTPTECGITEAV